MGRIKRTGRHGGREDHRRLDNEERESRRKRQERLKGRGKRRSQSTQSNEIEKSGKRQVGSLIQRAKVSFRLDLEMPNGWPGGLGKQPADRVQVRTLGRKVLWLWL